MPAPDGDGDAFERLKSVLLSPETARLSAAESQIEGLENWVGDAHRLEQATAQVLVEALRRAETARHRELASAIAPVVVAAIRAEIVNSRDMMVEALYPITGRMVAAAVSNAFRELLETINQRLDSALSTAQWRLRLRALATGRSVAEIALAEAQAGAYQRILLLERGSGRLLAMWRPDGEHEENPELVSGLVAAISEFAASVLAEHHGELRSLDLGASQVYLRASSRIILAAETLGAADRQTQKRIDAAFLDLVARRDRGEEIHENDLAQLAQEPAAPARPARASGLRWVVLAGLAVLALGWGLKGPVYRWRKTQEIDAAFARTLAAHPELAPYPLSLREDWRAGTLTVAGLSGSQADVARLVDALTPAALPLVVKPQVDVVARAVDLSPVVAEAETKLRQDIDGRLAKYDADIAALKQDVAQSLADVTAKTESLRQAMASAQADTAMARDLDAQRRRLAEAESRLSALKDALATIQADLSEPRRRIAEAAGAAVVWFGEQDQLTDPAAAARTLAALGAAIKATGVGVRVVGYADETGIAQRNVDISRQRAERVVKMLIAGGVPAALLRSVGRGTQTALADSTKDQKFRNRRVTFEPLFPGESAP